MKVDVQTARAKHMGRFSVDLVVANFGDVSRVRDGTLAPDKVRRRTITGVVDSGATRLVLPKSLVEQLGIPISGKTKVKYASGQTATRDCVDGVYVELLGRHGTFSAIVEPKRKDALIGAIVLEDLDFLIDCTHQRLVPRDPKITISEIE